MQKNTFDYEPYLLEQEGQLMRINFDVESKEKTFPAMDGGEETTRTVYMACVVRVPMPLSRGAVIDAIITAEYPPAEMQAVQNNYLANPEDEVRKKEFDDMQKWRSHAKVIADDVMASFSATT